MDIIIYIFFIYIYFIYIYIYIYYILDYYGFAYVIESVITYEIATILKCRQNK